MSWSALAWFFAGVLAGQAALVLWLVVTHGPVGEADEHEEGM